MGDAAPVALGALFEGAPTLLVFLRHLACPGCSEELAELAPRVSELADLGVRVVLVTPAAPSRLPSFAKRMHLASSHAVLCSDPSLATYRAAGLRRSAWSTYKPTSIGASLWLYALGHYTTRSPDDGDVLQQGGCLLLDGAGRVLLHHRADDLSDHVPMTKVVDLALELAATRAGAWA